MDTILDILRAWDEDPSMQKKVDLVQIIVVISSGILSSTTIATVVKAWLDAKMEQIPLKERDPYCFGVAISGLSSYEWMSGRAA